MTRISTIALPNTRIILGWCALVVGVLVNLWVLWVVIPEVGKEMFRFGRVPDVSSGAGLLGWLKHVLTFGWLPAEAVHIHLVRKITLAAGNAVVLAVVASALGRRPAFAVGVLVVVTLALLFSPAVGNL